MILKVKEMRFGSKKMEKKNGETLKKLPIGDSSLISLIILYHP